MLAAAAGYWFFGRPKPVIEPPAAASAPEAAASAASEPASAPAASGPETLKSVREFVARNPEPAEAAAKGKALADSGQLLDGQFLLFKYAAEHGDTESARRMGAFYDPDTWSKEKSPMPAANPLEAARWYKQGAEAGDAESQYRYGMLLKQGRTDDTNGPEMAVGWLKKAADQGHAEAKKALGQ